MMENCILNAAPDGLLIWPLTEISVQWLMSSVLRNCLLDAVLDGLWLWPLVGMSMESCFLDTAVDDPDSSGL